MRNGFAVVDTTPGVREAYQIVSTHRTKEAAEAVIAREIRATERALKGKYGSFRRVFSLIDGAIGEQISYVGDLR